MSAALSSAASPAPAETSRHAGIVQAVRDGQAVIAVAVQGCASCGQKRSCGVGKMAGGGKTTLVRLPASAGMRPGDVVSLSLAADAVNRAALLGYLLPAVVMVVGTVVGNTTPGGDLGAAGGALAGLALGLLAVRLIQRFFSGANAMLTID